MATSFAQSTVQPLILELLGRRNWFEPKRLTEIEETLQRAKPGVLPEVTLIRAGFISEQEVASVYGEELFLPTILNSLDAGILDKALASLLSEKLCADRLICPISLREDTLDVLYRSNREAKGIGEGSENLDDPAADLAVYGRLLDSPLGKMAQGLLGDAGMKNLANRAGRTPRAKPAKPGIDSRRKN